MAKEKVTIELLLANVEANNKKLNTMDKKLSNINKTANNGIGGFKKLGIAIGAAYAVNRVVKFAAASVKAYQIQAKAEAKVKQAIISTNKAAGKSFDELTAKASALQKETLFGDEDILNNVTAQLLTFTNIANEEFDRTQRVALDLATVLDGDLKSASLQLGKALNDPVANLSALSRSGIQFSKEQKAVIKNLAETNRLAEAQGVILSELERQYGGQAKAAAEADGGLTQLSNSFGDLQENIGGVILEGLRPFVDAAGDVVSWMNEMFESSTPLTDALEKEQDQVNLLVGEFKDLNTTAERKKEIYNELARISPEIVEGVNAETIAYDKLNANLVEYNKQQLQKIAFTSFQESYGDIFDDYADAVGRATDKGREMRENIKNLRKQFKDSGDEVQSFFLKLQASGSMDEFTKNWNEGFAKMRESGKVGKQTINEIWGELGDAQAVWGHRWKKATDDLAKARIAAEEAQKEIDKAKEIFMGKSKTAGGDGEPDGGEIETQNRNLQILKEELSALEKIKLSLALTDKAGRAQNVILIKQKKAEIASIEKLYEAYKKTKVAKEEYEAFDGPDMMGKSPFEVLSDTEISEREKILEILNKIEDEKQYIGLIAQEDEILRLQNQYAELIKMAKKFGFDTTSLTEKMYADIDAVNKKYTTTEDKKSPLAELFDISDDELGKIIDNVKFVTDAIGDMWGNMLDARNAKEEELLEKSLKRNEANRESELSNKNLTEKDIDAINIKYDNKREAAEIKAQREKADREKKLAIFQATINLASGLLKIWTTDMNPIWAAAHSALLTGIYATQVTAISGAKFADGGLLQGKSHANGGITLATGDEAEGGEYIVNKDITSRYLPDIEKLNAGQSIIDYDLLGQAVKANIRTYVLERDISNAQQNTQVIENRAEL